MVVCIVTCEVGSRKSEVGRGSFELGDVLKCCEYRRADKSAINFGTDFLYHAVAPSRPAALALTKITWGWAGRSLSAKYRICWLLPRLTPKSPA